MVPHFFRTLLQRGAKLSAWTLVADVEVELLRCGYAARCSRAGCRQYRATTIVRYSMPTAVRYASSSRFATSTPS